jgi:hypothetical protein
MNLYLLTQDEKNGYDTYDTYDSAVVSAMSEEDARKVSPSPFYVWRDGPEAGWYSQYSDGRAERLESDGRYDWGLPENVTANLIGTAIEGTQAGEVICASFNAG